MNTPPRPRKVEPEVYRGDCPMCDDELESKMVYIENKGYLIYWQCINPECDYKRVL